MEPFEFELDRGILTGFHDLLLDFGSDLLDDLFDPGRVHSAIGDKHFE